MGPVGGGWCEMGTARVLLQVSMPSAPLNSSRVHHRAGRPCRVRKPLHDAGCVPARPDQQVQLPPDTCPAPTTEPDQELCIRYLGKFRKRLKSLYSPEKSEKPDSLSRAGSSSAAPATMASVPAYKRPEAYPAYSGLEGQGDYTDDIEGGKAGAAYSFMRKGFISKTLGAHVRCPASPAHLVPLLVTAPGARLILHCAPHHGGPRCFTKALLPFFRGI